MYFLIFYYIITVIGIHLGLYYFFESRGEKGWKAFVPFLNKQVLIKYTGNKKRILFWFFIPFFNLIAAVSVFSELLDAHRMYDWKYHYLGILGGAVYFPHLFKNQKPKYFGPKGEEKDGRFRKPKNTIFRELSDTIVFALSAAMIFRLFIFENYTIPTPSLEGTMLVGDFLVVDKFTYGMRMPNTPLSFPLVHNTLPIAGNTVNSYLDWIEIPYIRLPKIRDIKRNDLVVFNFPEGDTVTQEYQSKFPYLSLVRAYGSRAAVNNKYNVVRRPVDKRDNYVKRCVAIPGDKLQIKDGELQINDAQAYKAPRIFTSYNVVVDPNLLSGGNYTPQEDFLNLDINYEQNIHNASDTNIILNCGKETVEGVRKLPYVKTVTEVIEKQYNPGSYMFPHDTSFYKWTVDNFGPITMPKKGAEIVITNENFSMYERAIRIYEGNTLERKEGKFFINGKETNTYTFKMDYYFMMGDNRHNSQDSRSWGFVPEDHIVGKPFLLVFSWDKLKKKIRTDRFFRNISSNFTPN